MKKAITVVSLLVLTMASAAFLVLYRKADKIIPEAANTVASGSVSSNSSVPTKVPEIPSRSKITPTPNATISPIEAAYVTPTEAPILTEKAVHNYAEINPEAVNRFISEGEGIMTSFLQFALNVNSLPANGYVEHLNSYFVDFSKYPLATSYFSNDLYAAITTREMKILVTGIDYMIETFDIPQDADNLLFNVYAIIHLYMSSSEISDGDYDTPVFIGMLYDTGRWRIYEIKLQYLFKPGLTISESENGGSIVHGDYVLNWDLGTD